MSLSNIKIVLYSRNLLGQVSGLWKRELLKICFITSYTMLFTNEVYDIHSHLAVLLSYKESVPVKI